MSQKIKPQIKWTNEKIELLKREYPTGDKEKLCQDLGVTRKVLKYAARRFGTKSLLDPKKYQLKKLYEEDTPINYYWYGFIIADGNINDRQLRISLSVNDEQHLDKLKLYLNKKKLKKRKIFNYGKFREYVFLTVDDCFYCRLLKQKLNITTAKTYEAPNLSWLDEDWKFLSFLCGFIDGDGMIQKSKNKKADMIRIQCHKNWLQNLEWISKELLTRFNIVSKTGITKRGYSYFVIYRFSQLYFLKEKFTELGIPKMERKWQKISY
jgi:hypothetical protein